MYPIKLAPVASQKILPASSGWQALTMLAGSMPTSSTGFPSNRQYQQFRRSLWAAIGRIAPGRQQQGHVIGGPYMPGWNEYYISNTDGFGFTLHRICPIKMGFKIRWKLKRRCTWYLSCTSCFLDLLTLRCKYSTHVEDTNSWTKTRAWSCFPFTLLHPPPFFAFELAVSNPCWSHFRGTCRRGWQSSLWRRDRRTLCLWAWHGVIPPLPGSQGKVKVIGGHCYWPEGSS